MDQKGDTIVSFKIPGTIPYNRRNDTRFHDDHFANTSFSGVVTDDTPLQALRNSLDYVQSPLQARLSNTRAQIQSVGAIREGLK